MTKLKVIIQGDEGSNHHAIALKLFKDQELELISAKSFPELFALLDSGVANLAIMAIENSIAGSILQNFDLLTKYKFPVVGEGYLRIEHCLIGLEDSSLADIKVAYTHEMAIKQCVEFFAKNNIEAREYYDTAAAVPYIKNLNDKSIAAVAPAIAASIYGLKIIAKGIEATKDNYTRFIVLNRGSEKLELEANEYYKTMVELKLTHSPGSLVKVLNVLAAANYNLTKIESRPIIGESWHYIFYLDFISTNSNVEVSKKLEKLSEITEYYRILGMFKAGKVFQP